jgi:hypothetical protein|tara:strand:- start:1009 stop:1191 length:183 start_codon:yes stop_codon:yes gene_type:complete
MNITSAQYVFDEDSNKNFAIIAIINGVTISVPIDEANRHYQEILEWVAEGNTITDNGGGE